MKTLEKYSIGSKQLFECSCLSDLVHAKRHAAICLLEASDSTIRVVLFRSGIVNFIVCVQIIFFNFDKGSSASNVHLNDLLA